MDSPDVPADILDSANLIQRLRLKTYLSRGEREAVNRAKLKIAFWACRNEDVSATRENLTYILGQDAAEIMGAYDKYLESESDREKREERERADKAKAARRRKDGSKFWESAQ